MLRKLVCVWCLVFAALPFAWATDSVRVDSLNQVATSLVFEQAEEARGIAEQAEDLAAREGLPLRQANALHTIGLSYHVSGDYNNAISSYQQAIDLRRNTADEVKIAGLLNNIASIYTARGDYSRALELYQESLSLKQQANDQRGMANTLNNIGIIHYKNKDYDKAISYYQRGFDLRLELELESEAAASYGNIGLAYFEQEDFELALEFYHKGLDLVEGSKQVCNKIYLLNGLGISYYAVNELDLALQFSTQAYEDAVGCDDKTIQATAINNLGKVNLRLGDLKKAEQQLRTAYTIARENGLNAELADLTESLYQYYKETKQASKALGYYEEYVAIRDSLGSTDVTKQITTLELTYAFQQEKDSLQFAQQREILTYTAEAKRKNVIQTFTLVVLALLLAIVLILVINFRSKQKTNRELRQKNAIISEALQEKEMLIKEIHHRVKNNLQIISSMLNIQRKTAEDAQTKAELEKAQNRVMSMAMVHNSLYGSNQLGSIDAEVYLVDLIETLNLALAPAHVNIHHTIQSINLSADLAISLGLLINEMVTNAAKYAFPDPDKPGCIEVEFTEDDHHYRLTVADDGVGFQQANQPMSFGMQLIQSVVYSLKADMQLNTNKGTQMAIEIPKADEEGIDR